MSYKYVVLGAGIQGTAAAYDMAKYGEAESVLLLDVSQEIAQKSADRVNKLMGKEVAKGDSIDVTNSDQLIAALKGYDACLSAVPYQFNVQVADCCVKAGVGMCDLGGNSEVVFKELELDAQAKAANVSIIPDCGLMPGMGNHFAAYGIEQLDSCDSVQVRCGGLPQDPKPPLGYKLVFSIGGLTNEYFGQSAELHDGKIVHVDTFSDLETLEFPELGQLEAFTTSGGTSTCPWTYEGKVNTYQYKTIRYPGHYEKFKLLLDLGLLELDAVNVKGQQVVPRDLFHTVVQEKIDFPEDKDMVVIQTVCKGKKDGKDTTISFTLLDYHDDETGFSAMARTTGYSAAVVAMMIANGEATKGAVPLEKSIPGARYVEELKKRGFALKEETV